jgi:diadenylate cyclase
MFELFNLGFISVTLFDLLDIGLVTTLFYLMYKTLKHTIAVQVLFGLIVIFGLSFLAEAINLKSINWILRLLSNIWLIAFIIIFQQELRQMIVEFTIKNPILQFFTKKSNYDDITAIVEASIILSKQYTGALMVFPQTQEVSISSIDAGISIGANVSKELLLSIFNTKSPLHDGAVIIDSKLQIRAARCILPLSSVSQVGNRLLGTRHRAGLGLTEKIDAVVLIVSEETGAISIAKHGKVEMGIPYELIRDKLKAYLNTNL